MWNASSVFNVPEHNANLGRFAKAKETHLNIWKNFSQLFLEIFLARCFWNRINGSTGSEDQFLGTNYRDWEKFTPFVSLDLYVSSIIHIYVYFLPWVGCQSLSKCSEVNNLGDSGIRGSKFSRGIIQSVHSDIFVRYSCFKDRLVPYLEDKLTFCIANKERFGRQQLGQSERSRSFHRLFGENHDSYWC